jgi:hypothetical protein
MTYLTTCYYMRLSMLRYISRTRVALVLAVSLWHSLEAGHCESRDHTSDYYKTSYISDNAFLSLKTSAGIPSPHYDTAQAINTNGLNLIYLGSTLLSLRSPPRSYYPIGRHPGLFSQSLNSMRLPVEIDAFIVGQLQSDVSRVKEKVSQGLIEL